MSHPSPCKSSGFWAYQSTLFLGALNDNIAKLLVMCYGTYTLGTSSVGASAFLSAASACFILPFLLFSHVAGYLSDRWSKKQVMVGTKVAEILIMTAGLILSRYNAATPFVAVLFCMGAQSAFFSPAKYGFLPETCSPEQLSRANGITQLSTFVAIIAGGAAGGYAAKLFDNDLRRGFLLCIAIAFAGTLTSLAITKTPAGDSNQKFRFQDPISPHWRTIREMHHDRKLFRALLGNCYFWFVGTIMQLTLMLLAQNTLHGDNQTVGTLQAAVALGIGGGCMAAGLLAKGRIPYRFVQPGAIALAIAAGLLALTGSKTIPAYIFTVLLGICGGFYQLPLGTAIQERSPKALLGRYLAAGNALDCIAMVLASVVFYALRHVGCNALHIVGVIAIITLAVAPLMRFEDDPQPTP